ncbi:hypothetical protein ABZV31_01495 [Streptomyces sp. NPDC005202]
MDLLEHLLAFAHCPPLPARTTVVSRLVREGVLVEVDAVALVG